MALGLLGVAMLTTAPAAGAAATCDVADYTKADGSLDTTGYLDCVGAGEETAPKPGADCPTADATVRATTSPAVVTPGSSTRLTAAGFAAGSKVDVYLCSPASRVATVTADASGGISTDIAIPAGTPVGAKVVAALGQRSTGVSQVAYASLTVASAATVAVQGATLDSSGLPITGGDFGKPLVIAAVFVVLGAAAVVGSLQARRRTAHSID
jgi:hypothetical protein